MKVSYYLYNITQIHQDEIKSTVQKNIDGKIHSYIKSLSADAGQILDIKIERNKKNKYLWTFLLVLNGKQHIYKTNSEWFRIVEDLVNHAFDRFKEILSHK
jgi:hypothetical protein